MTTYARGFLVHFAQDGLTGLARILSQPPDLVLSDADLAGLSGLDLLERLRMLHPRLGSMPFVFLTAQCDHECAPRQPAQSADVGLRDREVETLTWAARGKTFWEIGRILGLSKRTVEFHLDSARRKLGVATRTQALIKAATSNLIQP